MTESYPIASTPKRRVSSISVVLSIVFVLWSNSSYAPVGRNSGFYCNDTSIRHMYHGDSISAGYLFLTLLGGALVVIYVTELVCHEKNCPLFGPPFSLVIKTFYSGFVYVLAFTEVLKFSCGELRPHFLHTCQPNLDQVNCSLGLVTDFKCLGSGPKWLIDRDIYKSFPSGHASLSLYTFVFLSVYVNRRQSVIPRTIAALWRALVVAVFFAWASACCVSRAMDHRHFWWDIMAGMFIGTFSALIIANTLLNRNIFKRTNEKSC